MKYSKKVKTNLVILTIIFLVSVFVVSYFSKLNLFSVINNNNLVKYGFIVGLSCVLLLTLTLGFGKLKKKHLVIQLINYISLSALLMISFEFVTKFEVVNIFKNLKILLTTLTFLVCLVTSLVILIVLSNKKVKKVEDKYIRFDTTTSPLKTKNVNSIEEEFNKARGNSVFYAYEKTNDVSQYFEEKKKQSQLDLNDSEVKQEKYFNQSFSFDVDINNAQYQGQSFKNVSSRNVTNVNKLNEDFMKDYNSRNGL